MEVQTNHYHFLEPSSRKSNNTSHDQFKSAKLNRKPNPQNRTTETNTRHKERSTQQVVQLTKTGPVLLRNLQSKRFLRCAVFLIDLAGGRREEEGGEKT